MFQKKDVRIDEKIYWHCLSHCKTPQLSSCYCRVNQNQIVGWQRECGLRANLFFMKPLDMTLEIKILLVSLDHDDMESVVNFPLASDMLLVTAVSITVKSSILSIKIRKENIFSCMNWPLGVALHTVTFLL